MTDKNKEAIEKLGYIKNQYHTILNFDDYDEVFDNAIKALEERPTGRWIPVSERLPDRFGNVLVTFQKPNREPIVYRAVYVNGKFDLDNGDTWNWNDPEIKAWMPIPEAYKEAENVSKN